MVSEGLLGFQAPLGKKGHLLFQAKRDSQGCLASLVFQEREESQAQMENLEERERLERKAGLACRESREREVPKETGDLLVMQEKQLLLKGGNLGMLGLQEMADSQEKEVIKEAQGCEEEEEIPEEMDHLDSTEGRLG